MQSPEGWAEEEGQGRECDQLAQDGGMGGGPRGRGGQTPAPPTPTPQVSCLPLWCLNGLQGQALGQRAQLSKGKLFSLCPKKRGKSEAGAQ